MPDLHPQVRAVIESWRNRARDIEDELRHFDAFDMARATGVVQTLRSCADELEKALASAPPLEPLPMAVRVLEDVARAAEESARYTRERAPRLDAALAGQATGDAEQARQCREAIKVIKERG